MPAWLKTWGPWIYRAAVLIIILLLAYAWNSAHRDREALSKELERQKLAAAGLIAEKDAKQRDLDKAEKEIVSQNELFRNEKERLQRALDAKPKVVEVIKWRTEPTPVGPGDQTCPEGKKAVLLEGDKGHIEASEVTYRTEENNHVFLATASCWRDTPTKLKLFENVVRAPVDVALMAEQKPPFRWGGGVMAAASSDKAGLGPVLLFPTYEFLGVQLDASAGAAFWTTGFVAVSAQAGVRWR